jgi:hypothetical protein
MLVSVALAIELSGLVEFVKADWGLWEDVLFKYSSIEE